ncbi:MAG TPA: hypothetical protein GXX25_15815, partial [Desulfotomaculum sp.]|nr:hypothetical protein [Desulfotomaculum sp.]
MTDVMEMEEAFALIGSIRDLRSLNPDKIAIENPVEVTTGGPPFLMSDNPEWIKEPGVHSLATFSGKARFFWFIANHTPPADGPLYVTLVGENRGEHSARVRVTRLGYSYNGTDSELAGQEALYQYLAGATAPREVLIPVGGREFVVPELNKRCLYNGWVTVLYLEVETDQPVTFYVEAVHQPTTEVDKLTRLTPEPPREIAGVQLLDLRGTFPASEREMHFIIDRLPARVLIAADEFHLAQRMLDRPLTGVDEMTGERSIDDGNYGLLYRLRFTITAPTEKPVGIYFSPVPTSGLATVVRVVSPYQALERLPRQPGSKVLSPDHGVLAAVIPPTVTAETTVATGTTETTVTTEAMVTTDAATAATT